MLKRAFLFLLSSPTTANHFERTSPESWESQDPQPLTVSLICHSAFAADLGVTFLIGEQERRTLSQDGLGHLELIPL